MHVVFCIGGNLFVLSYRTTIKCTRLKGCIECITIERPTPCMECTMHCFKQWNRHVCMDDIVSCIAPIQKLDLHSNRMDRCLFSITRFAGTNNHYTVLQSCSPPPNTVERVDTGCSLVSVLLRLIPQHWWTLSTKWFHSDRLRRFRILWILWKNTTSVSPGAH